MRWVIGIAAVAGLLIGVQRNFKFSLQDGWHARFRVPCGSNERRAIVSLKTLASAQTDFRANDRDQDGKANFWRADIAGLYALAPGEGPAIKLIELSLAAADDRPVADLSAYTLRSPMSGYEFRALRHANEDPKALDPNRYAYGAYPALPNAGQYQFVLDETRSIWHCTANGRRSVDVFPTEEELRLQWSRVD